MFTWDESTPKTLGALPTKRRDEGTDPHPIKKNGGKTSYNVEVC